MNYENLKVIRNVMQINFEGLRRVYTRRCPERRLCNKGTFSFIFIIYRKLHVCSPDWYIYIENYTKHKL